MKITIALEDNFSDIVTKASRGTGVSQADLATRSGIPAQRLRQITGEPPSPTDGEARAIAEPLGLDGGKLADLALDRWQPKTRDLGPRIDHQVNAPHWSNGYFVEVREAKVAAFVDPGGNADHIEAVLREKALALHYILVTHKHYDHTDALAELRHRFPDAKVVVHALDAGELGPAARGAIGIEDGGTLPFGGGELRTLHTPGHTDGSSCFLFDGNLFTGDTLFSGSVGRIFGDRFGYRDLLRNVADKILTLPDGVIVLPGHGPPSTVGEERDHNPFF
ncbi:MAG TPA: MBL fold metallo-hydrolase [Candidatus Eremiobacteraceae bacterium]|nr:MBL fold metallo-hydrolase [Candidatus Eremiobacteraceae bacterium]